MKTILFFLFAFSSISIFAQDTLYTTQGKVINGKVTEVTQDEIKYKKASNPDGPTYIIDRSQIVLIQYKNGSKDVFENSSSGNVNTNDQTASSNNTVIVDRRPRVNLVVGALPYIAWGGGWGWGGYYRRPYYSWGHHHHGGHHHGGGHGHWHRR